MEKKNKYLRTTNVILKELNESFYVMKPFDKDADKTLFYVYTQIKGGGMDFEFKVNAKPSQKKSVLFNGEKFTDASSLLTYVAYYNSKLKYPQRLYDPMYRERYLVEQRIDYYLRDKLGFEAKGFNSYVLNTSFDNVKFEISVNMKDTDSTKGYLTIPQNDSNIYVEFDGDEDAIKSINSLVSINLFSTIDNTLKVIENMESNSFSNIENAENVSVESWLAGKKDMYVEKVIPVLENLLNTLKNKK